MKQSKYYKQGFSFFLENLNLLLYSFYYQFCVIYIHSINNRAPQWETGISFISTQVTSKIFAVYFLLLFSVFVLVAKTPKTSLPALQMLDAPEALEATVYHDGHACAQRFTLLHAIERKRGDL